MKQARCQSIRYSYLLAQYLYFVSHKNGGRKTFTEHLGSDELDKKAAKLLLVPRRV